MTKTGSGPGSSGLTTSPRRGRSGPGAVLGEHDHLVPGTAPLSRERARVDVGSRSSQEVPVPEQDPHARTGWLGRGRKRTGSGWGNADMGAGLFRMRLTKGPAVRFDLTKLSKLGVFLALLTLACATTAFAAPATHASPAAVALPGTEVTTSSRTRRSSTRTSSSPRRKNRRSRTRSPRRRRRGR